MCGIVGLSAAERVAPALALALHALQHRGQDAAGLATADGQRLHLLKDVGPVSQALDPALVAATPGRVGIGHVRYPTLGGTGVLHAQPYITRVQGLALAHNGNLVNTPSVRAELVARGLYPMSDNDGELLLLVLADELARRGGAADTDALADAVAGLMGRVRGAYAVVALVPVAGIPTLVAFRDPHGIRPAVFGARGDGAWMVASESVALDGLGFELRDEVPAGGLVVLRAGAPADLRVVRRAPLRPCVFEHVYFARADAIVDGRRVNASRWALGDRLAREFAARGLTADVIVAVPDTSRPAVAAMSERLGIPHREGFIKNRYSGRTFIMPDAPSRDAALRLKLNPIREAFEGQRVLLVDDSVVRGSTMRRIAAMVRSLDPAAVHLGVFSPPVRHPCYYGIDMPTREELVANSAPADALEAVLCERFGVDSVTYLSPAGLRDFSGPATCRACFDGDYPVDVNADEARFIRAQRRPAPPAVPPPATDSE